MRSWGLVIISIVGALGLAPLPRERLYTSSELLMNGGFEESTGEGPQGWLSYKGTISQVSSPVHSGSAAAAFTTTTADWFYQAVAVSPGESYTLKGYAVANDPNLASLYLRLSWYGSSDGTGTELAHHDSPPLTGQDPAYRFLTLGPVNAPTLAHSVKVKAMVEPLVPASITAYFDDLSLVGPSALPTPTPTATATPTPTPTPSPPANVVLNEILPAPKSTDWNGDGQIDSKDEWIELYNNSPFPALISGWQLGDAQKSYVITSGTTIAPLSFYTFFGSETELALNNDGDDVILLRPEETLADSYSYSKANYDEAFARNGDGSGGWAQTSIPTPNGPNTFPPPPPPQSQAEGNSPLEIMSDRIIPISLARAAPLGTKVYLRAQVSAPPNLMGARSMYVQDESGGLRVYVQHGDFPDLSLGDWALLTGDMIEQRGEQVIRIFAAYDAILLSSGAPPPPWSIATTKVGEENEGRLVIVEGLIESKSGAYIYVNDGSGLARIYVREATNIDTEPWVKGDDIQIVGIVSQWDSQPPYDVGYRLMPRFPQDLQPLSPPTLVISIPTPVSSPLPQTLPQTGEGWPVLTALGLGALALELGLGLKIWARGRRF